MWGFFLPKIWRNTVLILKDPPQLNHITDPDLLKLVTLRLTQLTPTLPHKMIIVEPRDSVEDLASSLDKRSEIEEISAQKTSIPCYSIEATCLLYISVISL